MLMSEPLSAYSAAILNNFLCVCFHSTSRISLFCWKTARILSPTSIRLKLGWPLLCFLLTVLCPRYVIDGGVTIHTSERKTLQRRGKH